MSRAERYDPVGIKGGAHNWRQAFADEIEETARDAASADLAIVRYRFGKEAHFGAERRRETGVLGRGGDRPLYRFGVLLAT